MSILFYYRLSFIKLMIRFRLTELIADKAFRERRVITLAEVAEATGIHRATLSKIANQPGANTVTDNLDQLCKYFGCKLEDLAQFVEDETDDDESDVMG